MEDFLQPTHLIFVFGIVLLILGSKELPDLGHGLGKGIRKIMGYRDLWMLKTALDPNTVSAQQEVA